jgi:hypothetical protein
MALAAFGEAVDALHRYMAGALAVLIGIGQVATSASK